MVQYSNLLNAYSSINITKLDVLDDLDEIQIGKAYMIDGKRLNPGTMPSTMDELSKLKLNMKRYQDGNVVLQIVKHIMNYLKMQKNILRELRN